MIVGLSNAIAINQHGTIYVQCPYCNKWYRAMNITRHIKFQHPIQFDTFKKEARRAYKKEEALNERD